MNIKDIYDNNDKIHENSEQMAAAISNEQATVLLDGEKWTLAEIYEHIAIVQDGMAKISAKLLSDAKATGITADGTAKLSENFQTKAREAQNLKFEAPDRVRPTGNQTIAESLGKMAEARKSLENLRPLFETIECSDFKFPHPFMGELTAHEWLTLIGGHEARHQRQIVKILEKFESK